MTAISTAPPTALHTFEIRPTSSALPVHATVDELMIDWGDLPAGSSASIYLPAVSANEVLALASAMYVTHWFSRLDANTLACGAGSISYLPIPKGLQQNYAGLLTVTLAAGAPVRGNAGDRVTGLRIAERNPFEHAVQDRNVPLRHLLLRRCRCLRMGSGRRHSTILPASARDCRHGADQRRVRPARGRADRCHPR